MFLTQQKSHSLDSSDSGVRSTSVFHLPVSAQYQGEIRLALCVFVHACVCANLCVCFPFPQSQVLRI